jgi:hypothetical protein
MPVKEKFRLIISPDTGLYLPREETVFGLPRDVVRYVRATPQFDYYKARNCPDTLHCGHYAPGMPMLCEADPGMMPEPGGRWPYGEWEDSSPQQATHVLINYTGWSDYSGSTVERSNYRSLLRDYPDTFTDVYGGHSTSELMLSVRWTAPDDGRASLLDDLRALADYPLYDEEDHSMLEMELADEAWDAYLDYDVRSDLVGACESPDAMEDMLETIEVLATKHDAGNYPNTTCKCGESFRNWDAILAHTGKFYSLRDRFYGSLRDMNSDPYSEDAVGSVVFPHFDEQITIIAEQLWEDRCRELPQIPAWFNPAQERLI